MIEFSVKNDAYKNDLEELVRPFSMRTEENLSLFVDYENSDGVMRIELSSDKFYNFRKVYRFRFKADDELQFKRLEKRFLKIAIYRTLSFLTGINLPYGCLTGIRPTKLYIETLSEGRDTHAIFAEDYSVEPQKLELIERIAQVQKPLRNKDDNALDLFVFIPFCPTRCAYCSFVSFPLEKQKKLVEPYIRCLIDEIKSAKKIIKKRGMSIRAVYIGGGTPTSVPEEYLDAVLKECKTGAREFTVEAGRPDTITASVASLLKRRGVTRLSVNPQTFNNQTLERIGRHHTAEEVIEAFRISKKYFDINMDLIAALPGESFYDFKNSLDKALELSPDNVTVHTLYLKKGSDLKLAGYRDTDCDTAARMVDYAYGVLSAGGYAPYYMYRQKYTSGNLENAGYAKPGKECVYNIDIMEEDTSIMAVGAAAISKKYTRESNLIERSANFKHPLEYIKHFDEVLNKQSAFWSDGGN